MFLTTLQTVLVVYIAMLGLMLLHIFKRKQPISRLVFANNITSHVVGILVLIGFVTQDYSMIDMSFIYVLLGPLFGACYLFFKKYYHSSNALQEGGARNRKK